MSQSPTDLFERIPRIDAIPVPSPATTGLAHWRTAWSTRHWVAAAVAAPALWLIYSSLAGPGASWSLSVAIALTSVLGGLILATFVPPRGSDLATAFSGCDAATLLALFAAGTLLQDAAASPTFGWLALGISGIAVIQRAFTASSC